MLLLCTCDKKPSQPPPRARTHPWPPLFDQALARPDFSNAVSQAERDLPDDRWEDKPGRFNASRGQREMKVTEMILHDIKPKLKQLSVTELVRGLKVLPYPSIESFPGVRQYLYAWGNAVIINEIKSRPTNELSVLPGLADDTLQVFDGDQGQGLSLAEVIFIEILGTNVAPKLYQRNWQQRR